MFRIAFVEPRIPPNTGNAIRMVAATGCELHLIGPLGFDLSDAKLRRAGLDYHDLASVTVHADLAAAWSAMMPARVFAFTARGTRSYTDIAYQPGDVLLFGPEPDGLSDAVLGRPACHRVGAHSDAGRPAIAELVERRGRRRVRSLAPAQLRRQLTCRAYDAWMLGRRAGS